MSKRVLVIGTYCLPAVTVPDSDAEEEEEEEDEEEAISLSSSTSAPNPTASIAPQRASLDTTWGLYSTCAQLVARETVINRVPGAILRAFSTVEVQLLHVKPSSPIFASLLFAAAAAGCSLTFTAAAGVETRSLRTSAPKPTDSIASQSTVLFTTVESYKIDALFVDREIVAFLTPDREIIAFSTVEEHDVQVMPSIPIFITRFM